MSRKLIVLLLAVVLSLAAAVQQPAEPQLNAGITGTYNGPDRLNPSRVLREPRVARLMLDLAETPRDRAWLESNLTGSEITLDDLQTIGLVREENGRFVIAFNLFTRADVMKVRQVAGLRTESLAEAYLTQRTEFEQALARYNMPDVDRRAIAYILIGCFSLNWDVGDVTATKKYRVAVRERPGLGTFDVWAEEKTPELSLEGVYWGSHNEYFPRSRPHILRRPFLSPEKHLPGSSLECRRHELVDEDPQTLTRLPSSRRSRRLDASDQTHWTSDAGASRRAADSGRSRQNHRA